MSETADLFKSETADLFKSENADLSHDNPTPLFISQRIQIFHMTSPQKVVHKAENEEVAKISCSVKRSLDWTSRPNKIVTTIIIIIVIFRCTVASCMTPPAMTRT
jgi:hypothetical protein